MTHLEKIAHDLEFNVYKDPMHGQIAKANFVYGVAQKKLQTIEVFKQWLADNAKITLLEENRDMLNDLLKRLEE